MPSATAHPDHRHGHHEDSAAGVAVLEEQQPCGKKQTVLDKLAAFFERYFGLG
jgi:hypothetical protein